MVNGGTRSKVYLRAQRLKERGAAAPCHDGRAEVVIRRRNGTEQTTTMRPRCLTSGGCSTDGWSCARRFTDA